MKTQLLIVVLSFLVTAAAEDQQKKLIIPVAIDGTAYSWKAKPENVIDGDYDAADLSQAYCTRSVHPQRFVYIDLGNTYNVRQVKLWGMDGVLENFNVNLTRNIQISVSNSPQTIDEDYSTCAYREGEPSLDHYRPEYFRCQRELIGQFVKVSMINVDSIQLFCFTELEIYGFEATPQPIDDKDRAITPIEAVGTAPFWILEAKNVIDGDYTGANGHSFCTLRDEPQRWVYVNLGKIYKVSHVKVWGMEVDKQADLKQMENLMVSVAKTVDGLDNPMSTCAYSEGIPTAGQTRPQELSCAKAMKGQYVRFSMLAVEDPNQMFCIAEVEVYGKSKSLLPIIRTTGSQSYEDYGVAYIADGSYADTILDLTKVFCTNEDPRFAQVDLGNIYSVTEVMIWSKDHIVDGQSMNLKIYVAETVAELQDANALCAYKDGHSAHVNHNPSSLPCTQPIRGQFVKVEMTNTGQEEFLCIAEIEVYGF